MSDLDVSFDSDGAPKCKNPPKSKEIIISRKLKIEGGKKKSKKTVASSDSDDDDENGASFLEAMFGLGGRKKSNRRDSDSSRSPSPKRSKVELDHKYDKSDDEEDVRYLTEVPYHQELTLKITYCTWTISSFSYCEVNTESYINSKIFSAGLDNEFQWYFRMERVRQGENVYYGVYACPLTHGKEEVTLGFRSYIVELRGHSYKLEQSSRFPKKNGFQFLGYLLKSHIRDDNYWYFRMIPEDELTLHFRIHIQFKKSKNQLRNDFKSLLDAKKFTDFNLIVKDVKFPVHKAILAARSSVFTKLFDKEKTLSEHEIKNVEPEMMKDLLVYLYTGRLKKLTKYLKDFTTVANSYNLTELKSMCDKANLAFE